MMLFDKNLSDVDKYERTKKEKKRNIFPSLFIKKKINK